MKVGDLVRFLRNRDGNWLHPWNESEGDIGILVDVDALTEFEGFVGVFTASGIKWMSALYVEVINESR